MLGDFNKKTNQSQSKRNKNQSARTKRQASLLPKDLKNKNKWFYHLPLVLLILLGLIQIYLSNSLATQGRLLNKLQQKIIDLESDNELLQSEAVSFGGLAKLTEIASQKGFIKNPAIVNYSKKVPVALKKR